MYSTGLARHPRSAPRRAPAPERAAAHAREAPIPRPPPSYGRVLVWGLGASVLLHLLVLLVSPGFIRVGSPPGATDTPYERVAGRAEIQLINPVVTDGAVVEPATQVTPLAEQPSVTPAEPPRAVVPVPGAEAPPPTADPSAGGRSVRERLQPGFRDPRLYVNPDELSRARPQPTAHQRYMEHFSARINAINDSMYAASAGADTDWTFEDGEGKRWGISEEGLHLGGFTVPRALIPLPGATGDNRQLEQAREEQRQREEIRRQEEARKRGEAREESTGETRERKAAERKKKGGGGGGSG